MTSGFQSSRSTRAVQKLSRPHPAQNPLEIATHKSFFSLARNSPFSLPIKGLSLLKNGASGKDSVAASNAFGNFDLLSKLKWSQTCPLFEDSSQAVLMLDDCCRAR